ncbi:MAG: 50S ribosomal protein L3 [Parcubacteria group bacterium GW2011_GWB1_48_6]|nr:MAG: 50S ribosomal protein L3 [Parcubacteria group bacterium GW2011_GWB1_48_6]HXK35673.1 50S ribosomal protein L3 [Candidatus Paceibacterota bacterium]
MKYLLGEKLGMSQIFSEQGKVTPVTVVKADPLTVTQLKTNEQDGYTAVQVGGGVKRNLNKPARGHLKELGNFRYLKEFTDTEARQLGDKIDVTIFAVGDKVKVSGLSKGRGFQGAMKRHGFHGMPASHGHRAVRRHVGSIGQRFPQHTLKGLRMAGRDGNVRISVRGLTVMAVDQENNLLALKGAVPGRKGTRLEIVGI